MPARQSRLIAAGAGGAKRFALPSSPASAGAHLHRARGGARVRLPLSGNPGSVPAVRRRLRARPVAAPRPRAEPMRRRVSLPAVRNKRTRKPRPYGFRAPKRAPAGPVRPPAFPLALSPRSPADDKPCLGSKPVPQRPQRQVWPGERLVDGVRPPAGTECIIEPYRHTEPSRERRGAAARQAAQLLELARRAAVEQDAQRGFGQLRVVRRDRDRGFAAGKNAGQPEIGFGDVCDILFAAGPFAFDQPDAAWAIAQSFGIGRAAPPARRP